MKLNPISICLCVTLILTIAKAQKYSKINKPVVDLNARPQVTTTPKLPEERRKLSVFPKSLVKYVVTSKPYSKVRSYSPWQVNTKRPLMQKLVPNDFQDLENKSVTNRPPLMKSIKPPAKQISKSLQDIGGIKNINSNSEENTKNNFLVFPINNKHTVKVSESSNFAVEDYEPEGDSTDEILSFSSSVNNETPNEVSSTEKSNDRQSVNKTTTHDITTSDVTTNVTTTTETQASELDNSRRKRLSVTGFSAYNYIGTSNKDSYSAEERNDNDEFIFMNDKLRPVYKPTSPTDVIIEDDAEIATEIVWLEESPKNRPERSVNIIEEEIMGTTVSGFKFTGREPRVNSYVVFKNINA